jgi:hypothetical protein
MNFKEYLKVIEEYSLPSDSGGVINYNTDGTLPQVSPNDFTRPDSPGEVPQHNIGLPQVTRRSKVVGIDHKAGGNVEIRLEDRTMLRLTQGQFRMIGGDPVQPPNYQNGSHSVLTVTFQRNPDDGSQVPSQITQARCENVPGARLQKFN